MKKITALLLALLLTLLLTACGSGKNVSWHISKRQITHDTGDVNLTTYIYNEEWKTLSTETLLNGEFASRVDYVYSEDGTVVTQNYTSATSEPSSSEHRNVYDEEGTLLEASSYHNGELLGITYYTYDDRGREIGFESVDAEGNPMTTSTRTYDDQGNVLSTHLSTNGGYATQKDYTYDKQNRCLSQETRINGQLNSRVEYKWQENQGYGTVYNADGTAIYKTLTVMDDYGNVLVEEQYDVLGTMTYRTEYEYIGTDGSVSSGLDK